MPPLHNDEAVRSKANPVTSILASTIRASVASPPDRSRPRPNCLTPTAGTVGR